MARLPQPPRLNNQAQLLVALAKPIAAKNWKARTKKRVDLIFGFWPAKAAKFVELFNQAFGPEKLPYLWIISTTKTGRLRTRFPRRFGRVRPDKAGLVGYTVAEENRRIAILQAEHRAQSTRAAASGK